VSLDDDKCKNVIGSTKIGLNKESKIVWACTKVSRCVDCLLAMGKVDVRWEGPNALSSLYGAYICGKEGTIVGPQAK